MKYFATILALLCVSAFSAEAVRQPGVTAETKAYTVDRLPNISDMGEYGDGYVLVQHPQSKLFAVFDSVGNCQIEFAIPLNTSMRGIPKYNHGVIPAVVNQQGKNIHLILDTKGQMVAQLKDITSLGKNFTDGYVTAFKGIPVSSTRRRVELHYYDTKGNPVFPKLTQDVTGTYDNLKDMRPFCDGLSCFYDYKARKYGYFDKNGNIVIPAQFADASDFSEGLAAVTPDGNNWTYIDTTGKQAIGMTFSAARPGDFHDGFATVSKRPDSGSHLETCYINKAGEIVAGPVYHGNRFFKGYAWVENQGQEFSIDTEFKAVMKLPSTPGNLHYNPECEFIQSVDETYNPDGLQLLDSPGYVVGQFSECLAAFKKDNTVGYMNHLGFIIWTLNLSAF